MAWTIAGSVHVTPVMSLEPCRLTSTSPVEGSAALHAFQSTHCEDVVGSVPAVKESE
jgi:hypothetical protein